MRLLVDTYVIDRGYSFESEMHGLFIRDGYFERDTKHSYINTSQIVRERSIKSHYSTYEKAKRPVKFMWLIPYMEEYAIKTEHAIEYYLIEFSNGSEIITKESFINKQL